MADEKPEEARSGAKRCGARSKGTGRPCRNWGTIKNGRCKLHGGWSPGAPEGNKNALSLGIYSNVIRSDEIPIWHEINVNSVDDEIRLIKLKIRRIMMDEMGVELKEEDLETGMQIAELKKAQTVRKGLLQAPQTGEGGDDKAKARAAREQTQKEETKTVTRRRPDYDRILGELLGRLAQMIKAKADMTGEAAGTSAEAAARKIKEAVDRMMGKTAKVPFADPKPPSEKKKRGRPKGSKNKK